MVTDEARFAADASVPWGRRAMQEPTLPILCLALIALLWRGYFPDIVLFAGAVVLIAVDATRWRFRVSSAQPASRARHRWLPSGALLLALGLAALPRPSAWQDVAFAAIGLVVLALVWSPNPESAAGTAGGPQRWWVWPALGVGLGLVELCSLLYRADPMVDDPEHPAVSTLVEPMLDAWPVRVLFLWAWLLGGWWIVRRVRAWAP